MISALDFNDMHGVWVTDVDEKGSYGQIAFREDYDTFWVRWLKHPGVIKNTASAGRKKAHQLRILPVKPKPWYTRCIHCGLYPTLKLVEELH